jgi:hypothetical protein
MWLMDNAWYDGTWKYKAAANAVHLSLSNGAFTVLVNDTAVAPAIDGAITWIYGLAVNANGYLGVGTNTPRSTLDLGAGGISFDSNGTTNANIILGNYSSTFLFRSRTDNIVLQAGVNDANPRSLYMRSGDTNYGLYMHTNGFIRLGSNVAPTQMLDVTGNIGASGNIAVSGNISGGQIFGTRSNDFAGVFQRVSSSPNITHEMIKLKFLSTAGSTGTGLRNTIGFYNEDLSAVEGQMGRIGFQRGATDDSGNFIVQTSLAGVLSETFVVNNAGVILPSAGINFGDTTLTDYKQGTWTPTVIIGASNASVSASDGRYTRVGNRVDVDFSISFTKGALTGAVRIGGLPYVAATFNSYATLWFTNFVNVYAVFAGLNASTQLLLYVSRGVTASSIQASNVDLTASTVQIAGNLTYFI